MFHTHAPLPRGFLRPRRMRWRWRWKMKMRWRWKWDDNYLTGTQEGERKKEKEKERTPTPTHLARNGQTLKGQGKRKSGRTMGQKTNQRRGGRTEAPDTTYKARAKAYLGTRRTQTWPREESAHEIGDQWGTSWWNKMHPHYVHYSW